MVHEIENFFGCYLLYCKNPKYKGHTYIGFTVDPNRRIKQHNTGKHAGGAWKTSGRGPWDMALIVHGFPNEISALRFEWAWQNPKKSRRLHHVAGKTSKETAFKYRFRVMCEMVRTSPWCRLPLTIRWLIQDYQIDFDPKFSPPVHMAIAYGPVKSKKVKRVEPQSSQKDVTSDNDEIGEVEVMSSSDRHIRCSVCSKRLGETTDRLKCIVPACTMQGHTQCLAKHFLKDSVGEILPVEGACPKCNSPLLWGDLIRHKAGCYQTIGQVDSDDDHWGDELQTQC